MKKYENVDIEVVKLAEYRDVAATSGDTTTEPSLCGNCPTETNEDCLIVA